MTKKSPPDGSLTRRAFVAMAGAAAALLGLRRSVRADAPPPKPPTLWIGHF
ncbi:MAG TPA: hypothetical protein VG871_02815 [Vicinamibacterales bacterium]|nr:hypothetical protein [Vicinamibacterales bacterium]